MPSPTYMPDVPPDYVANPSLMPRPYVRFEMRETEFRQKDGTVEYRDIPWALVMPPGSRDVMEKPAEDWIKSLQVSADAQRIPPTWPKEYTEALTRFRAGEELPVVGTPIKTWAALSKSQIKAITSANIFTIEDLAKANDETKGNIGMGAVRLVQMAQHWLEEKDGPGAMAQKLAALATQNEELQTRLKELTEAVTSLKEQVPGATKAK